MALFTQYAVAAAEEALDDAGWNPQGEVERDRTVINVDLPYIYRY